MYLFKFYHLCFCSVIFYNLLLVVRIYCNIYYFGHSQLFFVIDPERS